MKNIFKKLFSFKFIKKTSLQQSSKKQKAKGQSLVEFAIAFPVVIMLLAGVVEFGFMLNYYLSLLDATREAARRYSNFDPWIADPQTKPVPRNETYWLYLDAANTVKNDLEPKNVNDTTRKIVLDPAMDDVIVTVFSLCGNDADGNFAYSFPIEGGWHLYENAESAFTNESMLNARVSDAPKTGLLLVEVIYNYHQVLALPWITAFVPNPTPLRAYTIMPMHAAEYPLEDYAPAITCPAVPPP